MNVFEADTAVEDATEESSPADAPAPDLEDPSLYFNRELSWLDFNDRVLQLAEDESVPLLERVKFSAIWESNMDEFFMVRVANLHDQIESGLPSRGADGMTETEQLAAIRSRVIDQRERAGRGFERDLCPALDEHGIRIINFDAASPDEVHELEQLFVNQVFPVLTPLVIGRGRPFPYISNLSLSVAVVLHDPDQDNEILARVKVPKELLGRFLRVGSDRATLVPLDALIADNIGSLFPGMEVIEHSLFRVTRDTDYDVSDEADDVMRAVEEELRRRRFGEVVRLEVEDGMSARLRQQLVTALDVEEDQVYESPGMLDLSDLWDIVGVPGHDDLRDPPFTPVTPPRLLVSEDGKEGNVFAAIREGDILVHHPYDSFTASVERFVRQAVSDPDVLAIKQTVYRTSIDSPLVPGLIEAAERGKQAVCLVELKARFDESANIRWAKKLEQAGVHVVYGIPSLKTHVKCVLVVRREGGGVRHYVHIGTGNYNPKTARIYTDLGLFTADPAIGSDIAEMFNSLTGYARPAQLPDRARRPVQPAQGAARGDREDDGVAFRRYAGADPAEDELAPRRVDDPGALPRLAGGRGREDQPARHLRPAPGRRRRLREHRGRLDRRPLSRALPDLLLRAPRRAGEHLHRLGRPDATEPLQPRGAGHAGS